MSHSDQIKRASELRAAAEVTREKARDKAREVDVARQTLSDKERELADANRAAEQDEAAAAAALAAAGGPATAQMADRTATGSRDENIIDVAPRRERMAGMASTADGGGERRTTGERRWLSRNRASLAAALLIGVLVFLLLFWIFGRPTAVIEGSVMKQGPDNVATKVDQVLAGVTAANTKLDKIGGDVSQAKDNSASAAASAASAASAAAACKQACEQKPAAAQQKKKVSVDKREKVITEHKDGSLVFPPPPPVGRFWGWVHPDASVTNKRTCYADRRIANVPAECSSVEVFPRKGNEAEAEWNARVAAENGIAPGVKGATGTQFGRVQVK